MTRLNRSFFAQTLAWLIFLLGLALAVAVIALELQGCIVPGEVEAGVLPPTVLIGSAGCVAIGRLLTARRPENRISWVIALFGVVLPAAAGFTLYTECALNGVLALPGVALVAWFNPLFSLPAIGLLFILLPGWFPNGQFMSRRWAWLLLSMFAATFLLALAGALAPGNLKSGLVGEVPIENPFGVPWPFLTQIQPVLITGPILLVCATSLLTIISFVLRFRQATGDTRQQFKWFAAFLSTVVVVHILGFEVGGALFYPAIFQHWSYSVILTLSFGGFPVVIGLAIFKYRLYDIDFIIRRTLTYGALTAALAAVYFGGVIALQGIVTVFTGEVSTPLVTVISTLGIAAIFNPLRRYLQEFIDRRFYRRKYDAAKTLRDFVAVVRDEVDLDRLTAEMLRVVQETIQPAHGSLWLREPAKPPAAPERQK